MVNVLGFTPPINHIVLTYHLFSSHVANKIIEILCIDTDKQTTNISTKPLETVAFEYLQKIICEW